jgi:hypothetical protein
LKEVVKKLRTEADRLKNTSPTKESLISFLVILRKSMKELKKNEINKDVYDQLDSIESFRPFDDLIWINRFFQHWAIQRYRSDYYGNWKGKGKYEYDFDALILKLDALIYRMDINKR